MAILMAYRSDGVEQTLGRVSDSADAVRAHRDLLAFAHTFIYG